MAKVLRKIKRGIRNAKGSNRDRSRRALSVHQPKAWLSVNGIKTVENRNNPPPKERINSRFFIYVSGKRV